MNPAENHSKILSSRHPFLKRLVKTIGNLDFEIPIWHRIDDAVVYAVIGQMLSNTASSAIIARLRKEFSTSKKIILWAARTSGKSGPLHGVSQKKRKALRSWLKFSEHSKDAWKKWPNLPLAEYREEIEGIWGFGRWSADMIAIFYLARKDIWPESDAGINRAVAAIFNTKANGDFRHCIKGCETTAALYLWEVLNRNLLDEFRKNG
jgi:3-methyladenine DNA glycosylase/8-oxoguanine DNA glycosylase